MDARLEQRLIRLAAKMTGEAARGIVLDALYVLRRNRWLSC
jgi:hypothetical protein